MNKFVKSMLSLALAGSMAATVVPGVAIHSCSLTRSGTSRIVRTAIEEST